MSGGSDNKIKQELTNIEKTNEGRRSPSSKSLDTTKKDTGISGNRDYSKETPAMQIVKKASMESISNWGTSEEQFNSKEIETWTTVKQLWDSNPDSEWIDSGTNDSTSDSNWLVENEIDIRPAHKVEDNIDYGEKFKDIKGKTIEEIVSCIPKNALGRNAVHLDYMLKGFRYIWIDLKDKCWIVYVHDHQERVNIWIARVIRDKEYMDSSGEFHHESLVDNRSQKVKRDIAKDTHIIIKSPEQYISPIDHPEHYGREK